MDFRTQMSGYVEHTEAAIARLLPAATLRPARIHEAMRYTMAAGGKRLRPVLVLAAADLCGPPSPRLRRVNADPSAAAVAIECIHTYSLVHDDLPCMDDDDLRRGRPSAHKAFDEATAVLAGDALLTHAFKLVAAAYARTPRLAAALTLELAEAAGSERLIGGQMEDLLAEERTDVTTGDLDFIHRNKTAAMIAASLVCGGLCAGAPDPVLAKLREAGTQLGLAFQVIDDLLDATASTAALGKTAGKDAKSDKLTFVKLHGLEASRRYAAEYSDAAAAALRAIPGDAAFLLALVEEMRGRNR